MGALILGILQGFYSEIHSIANNQLAILLAGLMTDVNAVR
jgi:hypothetical protein